MQTVDVIQGVRELREAGQIKALAVYRELVASAAAAGGQLSLADNRRLFDAMMTLGLGDEHLDGDKAAQPDLAISAKTKSEIPRRRAEIQAAESQAFADIKRLRLELRAAEVALKVAHGARDLVATEERTFRAFESANPRLCAPLKFGISAKLAADPWEKVTARVGADQPIHMMLPELR